MRFCSICGAPSGTCNDTTREIRKYAGVTVTRLPALREVNPDMRTLIALATYWFNADKTEAVPDGSPDAAFLLVRKGSPIDPQVAEHYGIPTEVSAGDMTTPLPGANVNAQQEANRKKMEATRRITAEVADTQAGAQDGATRRQVSGMIDGRVTKEVGGSVGASGASTAGTGQAMPSSQAEALRELKEHSLSGSDLLTGTRAEDSKAYEDKTGDNSEAGANLTPSEQRAGAPAPQTASRTASVAPPPEVGATPQNLQPGTQEYTPGAGVAITPEGTERAGTSQAPPAPLGETAATQNPPALSSTPQSASPQVDTSLGEALEDEGVKRESPPSGV